MSLSTFSSSLFALALARSASAGRADCKRFGAVHPTPRDIPVDLWFGSFTYETDETKAYDMWWEGAVNPNDALTKTLVASSAIAVPDNTHFNADGVVDKCYLNDKHKDEDDFLGNVAHPEYDPGDFTVCQPWKERSCCKPETVNTVDTIKNLYGPRWIWDKCGALSPACDKFYLEESCFYECSPNAGLYRQFRSSTQAATHTAQTGGVVANASNASHADADWQITKMPIKASYWDAWHAACKDDVICVGSKDADCDPVVPSTSGTPTIAPAAGTLTVAVTLLAAAAATAAPLF